MPLRVEVVAAERSVFAAEADEVLAITQRGQIGILPRHAPLLTLLAPGELRVRSRGNDSVLAVSGGFLEVADDRVVVLADAAERAEEIDVARAEEARRRAADRLASHAPDLDFERARAALLRAIARLRVAGRAERSRPRAIPSSEFPDSPE
jgi:F-type H+-transporting ATPase subunit epsilon